MCMLKQCFKYNMEQKYDDYSQEFGRKLIKAFDVQSLKFSTINQFGENSFPFT